MNETKFPEKTPATAQAGMPAETQTETPAEMQTGAQIIVHSLIRHKVDVVFGYPGGQILDVYDELYRHTDQIKHVITAHEQGAAHAADGYARATGKVGVVIATSGPGATNLITGIATAQLDSIPLVAITGNVPTALLGKDSFQEIDIFGISMPVTKHNYIVKNINDLEQIMNEAFEIAQSGRPGPVLIDVPRDVQTACCSSTSSQVPAIKKAPATVSEEMVQRAAECIASSERPFIYCGGGVLTAAAGSALIDFAEHIDAVIGCSMMGLTAVPASHPRNLGMTGMHGHEAAICAKDRSDLVIAIGVRFSDRATGNKAYYTANKKFIHIDIDAAEIDKNVAADVALVGDLKEILHTLTCSLDASKRPVWQHEIREICTLEAGHNNTAGHSNEAGHNNTTGRFEAHAIIQAVQTRTNNDTIVVTDVGQHQVWVAQSYRFEEPRTFLTSGGLGTMGYGLGAAIGGCLGKSLVSGIYPQKTVLFTGDGSFGMNLIEMATAVSQGLPLVILIMNNGVLGMVRQWQTLFYEGRYSNTTLDRATDFVALAQAFGADGCRVDRKEALDAALDKAFMAEGPFVIDCVIDKDDKVFPMIPPGGTANNMLLG